MKSQLDKIRARLKAATPGHWAIGCTLLTPITKRWTKEMWDENEQREKRWVFAGFNPFDHGKGRIPVCEVTPTQPFAHENAEFIANAKQDIDRLIRALEKAVEQRNNWRTVAYNYSGADTQFRAAADDAEISAILGGEK